MKLLTVCLGNICRSPAAEGILADLAKQRGYFVELDSAGTAAYHVGSPPDSRSIRALKKHNIDISQLTARQVCQDDFAYFDWILAMDKANLTNLQRLCPESMQYKVRLFSSFSPLQTNEDVADPYYGDDADFTQMADHLTLLAQHFFDHIEHPHKEV